MDVQAFVKKIQISTEINKLYIFYMYGNKKKCANSTLNPWPRLKGSKIVCMRCKLEKLFHSVEIIETNQLTNSFIRI